MNENLLQLKKDFGKYGSWALWDDFGRITPFLGKDNFEKLIKPNIIFIGLNASIEVLDDWMGYHQECRSESWFAPTFHIRKLAEILREEEFETFKGAYMTDVIKNHYDPSSNTIADKIKKDNNLVLENLRLFENELKILSKISDSGKFHIIAMGNLAFDELTKQALGHRVYKIYHYANWGEGEVKERIREDLRKIINDFKN